MIFMNHQFVTDHPDLFKKIKIPAGHCKMSIYAMLTEERSQSYGMFFIDSEASYVFFQYDNDLTWFQTQWAEQCS